MFLAATTTIDGVLTHGVQPCIEFLDMVQDLMDDGDEEKALMLLNETKGKLIQIQNRLRKIESNQKNTM